jgi:short-subunit dehydrogenase
MGFFSNKVTWITGATSGIGLEMARQINAQGGRVILSARDLERLQAVAKGMPNPAQIFVLVVDMAQPDQFPQAVEKALAPWGRVNIMVHNAGISQRSFVHETSMDVNRRIMEVNFMGPVALTKALLPSMLAHGNGHFVVVSSLVGKFGFAMRSAYAASKHALHGYFESLRIELAHNDILVTFLIPGQVQTNISVHALDGSGQAAGLMDQMQEKGMPVGEAVPQMLRAIAHAKHEKVIGGTMERLSVKMKALAPRLLFNVLIKKNPRGAIK